MHKKGANQLLCIVFWRFAEKLAANARLTCRSGKSATRQQSPFYKGFVELFGWQHSGNSWQHVAPFPFGLAKFDHGFQDFQIRD
jgi:hypothetical protein